MKTGTSERPDLPIAVVIGGGGMGMSTARRLGQHCRVVLASLSADKNPQREAALKEDGIDAVAVQCDITDAASVAELAKFVKARGRLRTLAHVAALSPSMGDWTTLMPLCYEHHRGATGVHGLGTKGFAAHYGFDQAELLAWAREQVNTKEGE